MAAPTSSSVHHFGPNTASFLKIDSTNYLPWLCQMRSFLIGQEIFHFADGSNPAPSATIISIHVADPLTNDPTAAVSIPNPAYRTWVHQDQLVVSCITTTLTQDTISLTIGCDTAKEIWDCLENHFAQSNIASAASLQYQLMDMTKGTKTLDAYLQHAKSIVDALAYIQKSVDPDYLVTATLKGLVPDYLMLRTTILQHSSLPSFTDLRSRILAFEAHNPSLTATTTLPHTALYNSHYNPPHPSPPSYNPPFPSNNRGSNRPTNSKGRNNNCRGNNRGSRRYTNHSQQPYAGPAQPTWPQQPQA